jgi:hypothetical protein
MLTSRPPFTPNIIPGTHYCWRLRQPQVHSTAGRIRSIEKSNDIWNRTRDLLVCSIVPQVPFFVSDGKMLLLSRLFLELYNGIFSLSDVMLTIK